MAPRRVALAAFAIGMVALMAAAWDPVSRNWRAAELLWSLSRAHTGQAPQATVPADVEQRDLSFTADGRPVRARIYRLKGGSNERGVVVAHGVHYRGIDEKRLVPFAAELARAGLVVLTPELADLADYRITSNGVETIGAAARWLATSELVERGPVGVLGFSFAGGLALVAAGDPRFRDYVAYVTSVGGHHDLERVLGFFARNAIETPHGIRHEKAHEYGLVVLIYGEIEHFVPEPDQRCMRDALRFWLRENRDQAWANASSCETLESERLFERVAAGRLHELAPRIEQVIERRRAALRALSPRGRLSRIRAPVYLLHGSADSVIPPSETEWARIELGEHEHRALISPLLDHVEVSRSASLGNQLELVGFMGRLL